VRTATLATRPPSDAYSASPVSPDLPGDGRSPGRLADATPISGAGTATIANSANDPSGTAGGAIDANSASVEQLNALGAGMIGKRILEFRPYASTDELLSRRVLKRADYETIKAAVTAK
jgi:DNA uptake protein ComE-like DNA-binding protein